MDWRQGGVVDPWGELLDLLAVVAVFAQQLVQAHVPPDLHTHLAEEVFELPCMRWRNASHGKVLLQGLWQVLQNH